MDLRHGVHSEASSGEELRDMQGVCVRPALVCRGAHVGALPELLGAAGGILAHLVLDRGHIHRVANVC